MSEEVLALLFFFIRLFELKYWFIIILKNRLICAKKYKKELLKKLALVIFY